MAELEFDEDDLQGWRETFQTMALILMGILLVVGLLVVAVVGGIW